MEREMGKRKEASVDDALREALNILSTLPSDSPEQSVILKLMNVASEQSAIAGVLIDYLSDMPSGDEIVDELIEEALIGDETT